VEWIDVTERLPPSNTNVLINKYDPREKVKMNFINIGFRINKYWFYADNEETEIDGKYGYVTHWMPLPDEPKKTS